MAPKKYAPKLTADSFEEKYGALVREQYYELRSARLLKNALAARKPAILVSDALLKVWFLKAGMPEGGLKVDSAAELQERYGELVLRLSVQHRSPYTLCKALRAQEPPLYVTEAVCKVWFLTQPPRLEFVHSADRLELKYGAQLRRRAAGLSAEDLRVWLRQKKSVDCELGVCETWRTKDFSSTYLSIQQLELTAGEKLRLPQYEASFSDMAVEDFAQQLREHDPPLDVSAALLAQWHAKFHPSSGPLNIASSDELEELMGDVIRELYPAKGFARDLAWPRSMISIMFVF